LCRRFVTDSMKIYTWIISFEKLINYMFSPIINKQLY
jgi:hypothetical protein